MRAQFPSPKGVNQRSPVAERRSNEILGLIALPLGGAFGTLGAITEREILTQIFEGFARIKQIFFPRGPARIGRLS